MQEKKILKFFQLEMFKGIFIFTFCVLIYKINLKSMEIKRFKDFLSESFIDPQKTGFLTSLGSIITGSRKESTPTEDTPSEQEPEAEDSKINIPSGSYAGKETLTQGTLYLNSNKNAPLIVIFGGIDVGGRASGKYMLDYFTPEKTKKYTYFIANSSRINGQKAWSEIQEKIKSLGLTPVKKILYLFSGGYLPAMSMDPKSNDVTGEVDYLNSNFNRIYLVDIWIGNSAPFYKKLAEKYGSKIEYYSTWGKESSGGSGNKEAKKYIQSRVAKTYLDCPNHMATNIEAIKSLNSSY